MTLNWSAFPSITITPDQPLYRVHNKERGPTFFNRSEEWRFGPPNTRTQKFGVCYLGFNRALAAYLEKYGRFGVITPAQIERDALSTLHLRHPTRLADLTDPVVLGAYNVTAAHSTGTDYAPSQQLAAHLYDAGHAGIRYRIRHDPELKLEAIALFGDPGEDQSRFSPINTQTPIPQWLIEEGEAFGIFATPQAILP